MKKLFFVAYNKTQSENPNRVHAVIPPLEIDVKEGDTVTGKMVQQRIAERICVPVESVRVLAFLESDEYQQNPTEKQHRV